MQPDPSIQNSQVGVRVAGRLAGLDLSASYYHGRWGIPTPAWAVQKPNGIVDAIVMWPRMDVIGADIAGSIEKLKGLGYWVEAGLFLPQKITYGTYNDAFGGHDPITFEPTGKTRTPTVTTTFVTHIMAPEFQRGTVIPDTPFLKLTAGPRLHLEQVPVLEPAIRLRLHRRVRRGRAVLRARHGRPSATIVARRASATTSFVGSDLKLFSDQLLIRFFGAFKVPQIGDQDPKFTAVLFPQIAWAVWDATEL